MWPASHYGPAAPGAVWDEYQWEELLRRQEASAVEYMALVDYYGQDPDAHNLIARAMGWRHVVTNCRSAPDAHACRQCPPERRGGCAYHAWHLVAGRPGAGGRAAAGDVDEDAPVEAPAEAPAEARWRSRFRRHPLRVLAGRFVGDLYALAQVRQGIAEPGTCSRADPFRRLLHYSVQCAGKVAAGLDGYVDPAHRGLVIAHLKVAFHAASSALGWIDVCAAEGRLSTADAQPLTAALLDIRARLAELILDLRGQLEKLRQERQ